MPSARLIQTLGLILALAPIPILAEPPQQLWGEALDTITADLPAGLRETLASKPSVFILHPYDLGPPTDANTDVTWHLLDKPIDPRFRVLHADELGVVSPASGQYFRLALGVDDDPLTTSPPRRVVDHLINLAHWDCPLGKITVHVILTPASSDTLLAIIEARNDDTAPHTLHVGSLLTRRTVTTRPADDFGDGIRTFGGASGEADVRPEQSLAVATAAVWNRHAEAPAGTLLATLRADRPATAAADAEPSAVPDADSPVGLRHRLELPAGGQATLRLALNLLRHGPQPIPTKRQYELVQVMPEGTARDASRQRADTALRLDAGQHLPRSYAWYRDIPAVTLPLAGWDAAWLCALELPRACAWSPQDKLATPWYTFTRPFAHELFGWWSYGMHAHEHLTTGTVNLFNPALSQDWLRGHFAVQRDDGSIPYGVNRKLINIHGWLNTCPFLAWESWQAYLWNGDRQFLQEAYRHTAAYVQWWRSPARTRPGQPLQHWRDYIESVRDDADLPTWTATGTCELQEALDLNCYLLQEERSLAAMADELGLADDAAHWQALADRRAEAMQHHLWHEQDGLYYGRDLATGQWARVLDISTFMPFWCGLAGADRADRAVALLKDPTAFGTAMPIATLAVRHMRDLPGTQAGEDHWRGANWVQMTWLALQGLKRAGQDQLAADLAVTNLRAVFDILHREGHFREYYNSLTAGPSGLPDYIWACTSAAMIADLILGVQPTAAGLRIQPTLPADWPGATIRRLPVRGRRITLTITRAGDEPTTQAWLNDTPLPVTHQAVMIPWADLPADAQLRIAWKEPSP